MRETALELTRKAAEVFAARGIDQPRLDAELLLAHVLGVSRLQLYLQHDRPIADEELARFRALVRRRLKREPVQYIVGSAHFRELELAVDPRVLIPRPETEELVGHVLDWAWAQVGGRPGKSHLQLEWTSGGAEERMNPGAAGDAALLRDPGGPRDGGTAGRRDGDVRYAGVASGDAAPGQAPEPPDEPSVSRQAASAREPAVAAGAHPLIRSSAPPLPAPGARTLTALDLGTGSGAIALSLLKEGPFAHVVATDVSAEALAVARANAHRLGLADRADFRLGALWEAVAGDERFDVVASNPPYVAESERGDLAPEITQWEPAGALFAGDAGFDVLEPLALGVGGHLRPGGLLALEIGAAQAEGMRQRLEATGAFAAVRVVRDLAGRDRVVLAMAHSLARDWKRGEHA